jgi:DNA-binding CsgD family transcriptional regulator
MFAFSQDFKRMAPWVYVTILSCWVWFWLVGYSPAFVGQGALPASLPNAERLAFFLLVIIAAVACALSERTTATSGVMPLAIIFILLLMGTSAFALSGYQTLIPQSILATTGTALMGFSYGWALVLSQRVLSKAPSGWDIAFLYIAVVASAVVILALIYAFTPTNIQALIPILPAITWGISLLKAQTIDNTRVKGSGKPEVDRYRLSEVIKTPLSDKQRYYLIQLLVICVIVIALRSVGAGGLWGSFREANLGFNLLDLLPSLAVAVLFPLIALPAFWFHTRTERYQEYQIPLLVFIGLLLVLTSLEGRFSDTAVFSILAAIADNVCLTIFCFIVITSAQRLPYPTRFTLGLAVAFNHLVALIWMIFFETTGLVTSLIILLIAYVLVLLIAFRRAGVRHGNKPVPAYAGQTSQEHRLAHYQETAKLHGLTKREAEILVLLAQGRSVPYIQSALTLSEGTVRTHVSHIYTKLEVHTKQELIDLLAP